MTDNDTMLIIQTTVKKYTSVSHYFKHISALKNEYAKELTL